MSSTRHQTTLKTHRCSCGFCPKRAAVHASCLTPSLGGCVKVSDCADHGDKSVLRKRSTSQRLYLVTLLSLRLQSASSAHGHLPRLFVGIRLITSSSLRRLSLRCHFSFISFRGVRVLCRLVPLLSFAFFGDFSGTLSQLHSTDSSHIPLKGPMQDQISPGVSPPYVHELLSGYCIKAGLGFPFRM